MVGECFLCVVYWCFEVGYDDGVCEVLCSVCEYVGYLWFVV